VEKALTENTATVVVVTFGRPQMFAEALSSLVGAVGVKNIVIVDNNRSSLKEYESLVSLTKAKLEDQRQVGGQLEAKRLSLGDQTIHYIWPGKNLGGAGGFAVGCEYSCSQINDPYCLFMDDDAELCAGSVERLISEAERSKAPFVAPIIYNVVSKEYELGQHKTAIDVRTLEEKHPSLAGLAAGEITLQANGFVGVLCRTDCLREIGGVHAGYFILYDDVDTTYRLSVRYGPGLLVPGAQVIHKYSATAGLPYWKRVAEARSRLIFQRRNGNCRGSSRTLKTGLSSCVRNAPTIGLGIRGVVAVVRAFLGIQADFSPAKFQRS
jgi:GT2 family glycosyltransferase